QVASAARDSGQSVTNLSFGGNTGFPQTSDNRALEITDEFSWLPGRTAHRIKLGLYANATELQENQAVNQLGTFTFPSRAALAAPGLSNAEAQLICIGSAVPTPDWSAYLQDPSSIPSQCTDSVDAVTITPHPNVTVFDPGFVAPRAWRASLGVQRRIWGT